MRRLLLKYEGTNPTGTVKDRSSASAVAAALRFGFRATSVVSTGTAGSSIAAYSARAGLRAFIFCYEQASAPKLAHMAAVASDLILSRGFSDDLIGHWDRLIEEVPIFDCGASRNPYRQEGQKTIAYELAEQTGYRLPDSPWWRRWRWGRSSSRPGGGAGSSRRWGGSSGSRGWSPPSRPTPTPWPRPGAGGRALRPVKLTYTVAEGLACGDPGKKGEWVLMNEALWTS